MCGIAGVLTYAPSSQDRLRALVSNMTHALVHRGPDDSGLYVDDRIGLGMRRLAIIDVAHGQQPMSSDDGDLVLVYNGEIYNYRSLRADLIAEGCRFRTDCDTEVVLKVLENYGPAGVTRLEGMFAFALWNRKTHELMLARDWLGQKSLYWTETSHGLAFASEIKALLPLLGRAPDLNRESLWHYMSLRYLPGTGTFFEGIHKLPPAHLMTVQNGRRVTRELWQPRYEPKHGSRESVILDELDHVLREVVREHLMSEVPLGAFLSGGIDSSLVVAYASEALQAPLTTFSIGVHEESQSELPWAREVAQRYHTHHSETIVDPDLAGLTPRMTAALEEPVDPFGAGVYIVSEVARRHVTVALGGDGGDELFAGYDRYKGQALAELYAMVPRSVRHGVLRPIFARIPDSFGYNTVTAKLRWLDRIADSSGFQRYADSAAYLRFPHAQKRQLFDAAVWETLESQVSENLLARYFDDGSAKAFVDKMLHADCQTRLSENQLPIVDKLSMAHGLELRSPFLDRRVAEFAMRIPAALKMKQRRIKYVTRTLGARYLPPSVVNRPKKGFGFPLALWLRGPLRHLMQRTIDSSRFVEAGLFRPAALQNMLDEHSSGRVDHNYRLWMIFNLEIFWRIYLDGESVATVEDWISNERTDAARSPASATVMRA